MPLIETESLVVKSYGLAEADRIVVFLTRDHGVVRGVAKGARRLKSKFGSSLEPFSVVKLTFFQKDSVELVSIQDVELVRSGFEIASNVDFIQRFAYLAELLLIFSLPHDPNETLYRMVKTCVEAATEDTSNIDAIGVYFEIWLLKLAGFLPDWKNCENCGRELVAGNEVGISPTLHLTCRECSSIAHSRSVRTDIIGLLNASRSMAPSEFAKFANNTPDSIAELSAIAKRIIERSIGRRVPTEMSLSVKGRPN